MALTSFFTATGFLAAILLVWGQLWANSYKTNTIPDTVCLGLIWTFLGVTVALVAFALAGWSWNTKRRPADFRVEGLPLGLLIAVLIMTAANVFQSLVSLVIKLVREEFSSEQPIMGLETPTAYVGAIVFLFLIAGFIIVMSWLGTRNRWLWIAEVAVLVLVMIVVYVLLFNNVFYPDVTVPGVIVPRT